MDVLYWVLAWVLVNWGLSVKPLYRGGKVVWYVDLNGRSTQLFACTHGLYRGCKLFFRPMTDVDLSKVTDQNGLVQDKHQALRPLASLALIQAYQTQLATLCGPLYCDQSGKPKLTVPVGQRPQAVNKDSLSKDQADALFLCGLYDTKRALVTCKDIAPVAVATPTTAKVTRASRRANR